MNLNRNWSVALSVAALLIAGCSKKEEVPAPAASAADVPAPAQASSPAAAATPPAEESTAPDERAAAVEAALAEEEIASDARGQFAVAGTASSTYGDKAPEAKSSYTAHAATGAPDVERYSDNANSWASATADKGIEWLEVTFARPVNATQIRIRQNYNPGAIIKVELIGEDGSKSRIWQGIDEQKYTPGTIAWFDRSFDRTANKVTGARITLATNAVHGWNEIDAVQLLGD